MKGLLFVLFFFFSICGYSSDLDFERMVFPLKDLKTNLLGGVNIHGDTIIPFKYSNYMINPSGHIDGTPVLYSAYEEYTMKNWTLGWYTFFDREGMMHSFHNGKLCKDIEIIGSTNDDYIFFRKKIGKKKKGIINADGRVLFSNKFDDVVLDYSTMKLFNKDGLAVVSIENKYGCINSQGDFVVPCLYDYVNFIGDFICVEKEKRIGLMNKSGNIIYPCTFSSIRNLTDNLYVVCKDKKCGLMNGMGKFVTPIKYDDIRDVEFYKGRMWISVEDNGRFGIVDKDDNIIMPFMSECVLSFGGNNLAIFRMGGSEGLINRKGHVVVPAIYESIGNFICGCATVQNDYETKYIDTCGNEIMQDRNVESLSYNGLFCVKENDGYVFQNKYGCNVNPIKFDKPSFYDINGVAKITMGNDILFIDKNGKNIFRERYDEVVRLTEGGNVSSYYLVYRDNYVGLINIETKKILVPCHYDAIFLWKGIEDNMISVLKDDKYGYWDINKQMEIIPCLYDKETARWKKFQYLYQNR